MDTRHYEFYFRWQLGHKNKWFGFQQPFNMHLWRPPNFQSPHKHHKLNARAGNSYSSQWTALMPVLQRQGISVRWEQWAATDTSSMNLKGNISFKQPEDVAELWKTSVSYLWERNVLISNEQTFLHLKTMLLHGHCSDRAATTALFAIRMLLQAVLSMPAEVGLQASVGCPQLTPTASTCNSPQTWFFLPSTAVLGTNPGKLKTLPHDTHSARQYLFPNPSEKYACYSVLILSQTQQCAPTLNSNGG